jgi:hypothetical protein
VGDYLNDYQQAILKNINKFGWNLRFIRRPSGENPTAVIGDKEGKKLGVLEQGGAINFETGILIRADQKLQKLGGSPF